MNKLFFIFVLASLCYSIDSIDSLNNFTRGTKAEPSEVNFNFAQCTTSVNRLIDSLPKFARWLQFPDSTITKLNSDSAFLGDTSYVTALKTVRAHIADIVGTVTIDSAYIVGLKTDGLAFSGTFSTDTIASDTGTITYFKSNRITTDTTIVSLGIFDSVVILDTGSFEVTLTGCTTSPTGTAYYKRISDVVHLEIPQISGTSNSTAASLTGLPEKLQMLTVSKSAWCLTLDNGVTTSGWITLSGSGTVSFYITGDFTASGQKGMPRCDISYRIR